MAEMKDSEIVTFCYGLKLEAPDGKLRETDCADTEGVLRIIQSIPSPKAEPLKRWLTKIGYERVKEVENPELAMERMRATGIQKSFMACEKMQKMAARLPAGPGKTSNCNPVRR